MPFGQDRYDYDYDDTPSSSRNTSDTHLSRRPRLPATNERRRSSRHDARPRRESRRGERHDARESRRQSSALDGRDRSRSGCPPQYIDQEDCHRSRAARDPDRKARREERRASRQERAMRDPDREARRQERREVRRAERRASRPTELEREPKPLAMVAESEKSSEVVPVHNKKPLQQVDPAIPFADPIRDIQAVHASPGSYFAAEDDLEYGESARSYRQNRGHSRRQFPNAQAKTPPRSDSWHTSSDDRSADLEKNTYSRSTSAFSELDWYKRRTIPERGARYRHDRRCCCGCRRKWAVLGIAALSAILLIIIIAIAVVVSQNKYSYKVLTDQVNNTDAFFTGGATHDSVNKTNDGIGAGTDVYRYYQGKASNFPNHTLWVSFEDMWKNNLASVQQACGWLKYGEDDSPEDINDIYNAIQDRANASLVDHRFILALVLQESHGCVRIPHTTSSGGVRNTGLMQSHNGHEYNSKYRAKSILAMIQDGVQGTKSGPGLVQLLNTYYGDPYEAARGYNSGYIPKSGDLSEAAGATACYVSDIANRLTGWVSAEPKCPG